MRRPLSILLVLPMLVLLTACGGNNASAGGSSTGGVAVSETAPAEPATLEAEDTAETEEEPESPAEPKEAEEEPDSPDYPVGDPNNPSAVYPAPFWQGDDYFDIIAYFRACGASKIKWLLHPTTRNRGGLYCLIDNRELRVWGIDNLLADGLIEVVILNEGGENDTICSSEYNPNPPTAIRVDTESSVCMSLETLQNIFLIMEPLISDDCPFSGTGIAHTQIGGSYIGPHDD